MIWTDEICHESSTFVKTMTEMKITKKPVDTLGLNPYLHELVIEATRRTDTGKFVIDEDVMVPASTVIEKQKYTRVYRIAGGKDRAMNLSNVAAKMLLYIIYSLEGSQDYLQITPEQYEKTTGMTSRNTYKKGVEELWRYGYINPTLKKYTYWINPSILFGANRINVWPEKVVVKTEMTGGPKKRKPKP